ncbi:hypothetical protein C8Q70DRAFT_1016654 [Cubamyces menziesii]|nr:hypothetical protein C8Q70DRAFT_1016654 [Cubamyces menziesii]
MLNLVRAFPLPSLSPSSTSAMHATSPNPDSDYEPSQHPPEDGVDYMVPRPSRLSRSGTRRTSALFAPGGALDSQTSDTQWMASLRYNTPESDEPIAMVDASIQTDPSSLLTLRRSLPCCSELRCENEDLRVELARMEAAYGTLVAKLQAVRAALDEEEVFLDPAQDSQVEMTLGPAHPPIRAPAPPSPEANSPMRSRSEGKVRRRIVVINSSEEEGTDVVRGSPSTSSKRHRRH